MIKQQINYKTSITKIQENYKTNKKHLKNVGPIRHCEPPHAACFTLPFTRCRYCRTPPAHRCPQQHRQQRQRQRVTEGTAMVPWNGPNNRSVSIKVRPKRKVCRHRGVFRQKSAGMCERSDYSSSSSSSSIRRYSLTVGARRLHTVHRASAAAHSLIDHVSWRRHGNELPPLRQPRRMGVYVMVCSDCWHQHRLYQTWALSCVF